MKPDETIMKLFELNGLLEVIIFKEFTHKYSFPEDINNTHMRTLMMLHFKGSRPMSEISNILALEKGSFTPVANKLIKLGYIIKERSEEDRRVFYLKLTNKGTDLAKTFSEAHMAYILDFFGTIDESTRNDFFNDVDQMLGTLKAHYKGDIRPPLSDKAL